MGIFLGWVVKGQEYRSVQQVKKRRPFCYFHKLLIAAWDEPVVSFSWLCLLFVCLWDQFLHKRKQFRRFTRRTHSSPHGTILKGDSYSRTQLNYMYYNQVITELV
jgi:hypothetical protein